MPASYQPDRRTRLPAMVAAAAVQGTLAYLLLSGLAPNVVAEAGRRLDVFTIPAAPTPTPSPQPITPPRDDEGAPAEAEGAAGWRAEATSVVAPEPRLVIIPPPPVITAPTAGTGDQSTIGAAHAGSGPGAGGAGLGPGGGGAGGAGSGGGRGAERIAGGLRDSDYPEAAAEDGAAGTVFIRIRVTSEGRVGGCEVTRSSGSPLLDQTTCRLVERRFRYRPARDAAGRVVESVETTSFTWGTRMR